MTRPLPFRVRKQVESNIRNCRNLGLLLDKYQPWNHVTIEEEGITIQRWALTFKITRWVHSRWEDKTCLDSEAKGHWLYIGAPIDRIQWVDVGLFRYDRFDPSLYKSNLTRWKGLVASFKNHFLVPLTNRSRIVIGLGAKGTLEMGLSLQYPYGFPWIPPSAVKGLARTRALFFIAEKWGIPALDNQECLRRKQANQKTPLQMLEDLLDAPVGLAGDPHRHDKIANCLRSLREQVPDNRIPCEQDVNKIVMNDDYRLVRTIFGTQSEIGKVIFFGGYTSDLPVLVSEIMTPHYKKYAEGGDYPKDNDSPEPAAFLALAENQEFLFGLALRPGFDAQAALGKSNIDLLNKAKAFTRLGLTDLGIGGKTSSGMGLFEKPLKRDPNKKE